MREHTSALLRTVSETHNESKFTTSNLVSTEVTSLQSSGRKRRHSLVASIGSRQSARIQLARSKVVPLPPRVIGPLLEESVVDCWKVVTTGMTGGRDMLGTTDVDTTIIREQTNHLTHIAPRREQE